MTQGVTILLAFFVNILVISNYTPEASSDQPVIGKNLFMFKVIIRYSNWSILRTVSFKLSFNKLFRSLLHIQHRTRVRVSKRFRTCA